MSVADLRAGGYIMDPGQWLMRILFLETIAGVPGFTAAMIRHLRSLRIMKRDGGWIHMLLEEAENERSRSQKTAVLHYFVVTYSFSAPDDFHDPQRTQHLVPRAHPWCPRRLCQRFLLLILDLPEDLPPLRRCTGRRGYLYLVRRPLRNLILLLT
jgi:hypothetical protein